MNTRAFGRCCGWVCAALVGLVAPAAGLAGEKFTLASLVPDDVFMCVAGRHNPEREFVGDYWAEVVDVLRKSGLMADVMGLIGSLGGEETQAEAQKLKEMGTQLLEAVDWGQLCGAETAFAMRMPAVVQSGSGFSVGGPDQVFLARGAPGSGAKNFAGLVTIVETILTKIQESGLPVPYLTKTERMGANVATLMIEPPGPDGGGYAVSIAQQGDLIVIAMGDKILDQVLGLVAGKGSCKPLAVSPRFKQAFVELPAAEDEMFFFDMQRLLGDLRSIADQAFKAMGVESGDSVGASKVEDQRNNAGKSPEATRLSAEAFQAYERGEHDQALALTQQAHEKDPTDSVVMYNLACFHALRGNTDQALDWLDKAVEGGLYAPNHISQDPDLAKLRQDPRYQAALAKAATKAGGDPAAYGAGERNKAAVAKRLADHLLDQLGMMDYVAVVGYTEGYSTRTDSVCVLTADAAKLPLYAVFGKRKPQSDFARYLPAETVSFSVAGGIDFGALYDFLEETVRMLGPDGEAALQQWAGIQQQVGFNVRKDILSWLHGDTVSATLRLDSGDAWVWMLKVTDEAAARQKLELALNFGTTALRELATKNPMLGMLAVRTAPATHEKLPGFKNVFVGMAPQPMVCGVADGYIILAATEQAAALCLATAAKEHANVTGNKRIMSEALVPSGPFDSVSFTDQRRLGTEIAQVLGVVNMVGGMATMAVPDRQAQQALAKGLAMVGKLIPAARKIDFYKSTASQTTFDGKVWRTREATNYVSPAERGQAAPSPATS